jgi:cytoskeletal protein RodZ
MKIQKKQKKSYLFISIILIILAVASYGLFAYYSGNLWPFKKDVSPTLTTPEKPVKSNSDSDNNSLPTDDESDNNKQDSGPDKTPIQNDTPKEDTSTKKPTSPKPAISGYVNFASVANNKLTIRVTITQDLSSGTCNLKLTQRNTNKTITRSADVVQNPSSATCKGFDIPTSELEDGNWDIAITVVDGSKTGTISGTVSI